MNTPSIAWIVDQGGERLDKHLAQELADFSRAALQKLIVEGQVLVNGAPSKASYRVAQGDAIAVTLPRPAATQPVAEPLALDILYEDADVLVVNKPAGLVVHPGAGQSQGTLVNALLNYLPELALQEGERPGIVHRLDRDTSGLLLVAKHEEARQQLQGQFKRRQVKKVYLALVEGRLEPAQGVIEAPIGRDPARRKRMAVVSVGGRPARTAYQVRDHADPFTLLEAYPETGRTHQIRVHLAAIGHPVVGDRVYGGKKERLGLRRQFLHAWRLTFTLPGTGERATFSAPLPGDLTQALDTLGLAVPDSLT